MRSPGLDKVGNTHKDKDDKLRKSIYRKEGYGCLHILPSIYFYILAYNEGLVYNESSNFMF